MKFFKINRFLGIFALLVIALLMTSCAKDKEKSTDKSTDLEEGTITISGTVSNGGALTETAVLVLNSDYSEISSCTTNSQGKFSCDVKKAEVSDYMLLQAGGMSSIIVEKNRLDKDLYIHVNIITDYIATQLLGSTINSQLHKMEPSPLQRLALMGNNALGWIISTAYAQILTTVDLTAFDAQVSLVTSAFGVDATTYVTSTSFSPRVIGDDSTGSVADDFQETVVETLRGGVTFDSLIADATSSATPIVTGGIFQIRLASIALSRDTSAASINTALSTLVTTAASTAIGAVFERITTSIEKIKTAAAANTTTNTTQLKGVAISGLKNTLVSMLEDNAGATALTDSSQLTTMVDNTTDILQDSIVTGTASAAADTNLQNADGTINTSGISSVISNAAMQSGAVILQLNDIFTTTGLISTVGGTAFSSSISSVFTTTASTILTQVAIDGVANIGDSLATVSSTITSNTTTALSDITTVITDLGLVTNSVTPVVDVPSVTVPATGEEGFLISPISGNTGEDGTTATFTIRLTSQPTRNVLIDVSSLNPAEGVISTSLSFTTTTWNTLQTVTVVGQDDNIIDGDQSYRIQLTMGHTADDIYSSLNPSDIAVINEDNDSAGFTIGSISGIVDEAGGQGQHAGTGRSRRPCSCW